MENPSEAVFMIDGADVITRCTRAAADIFGWALEDLGGKIFADILLPVAERQNYRDSLHISLAPRARNFRPERSSRTSSTETAMNFRLN